MEEWGRDATLANSLVMMVPSSDTGEHSILHYGTELDLISQNRSMFEILVIPWPHFYLTVDCVIDNLLEARKSLNAKAAEGIKISVNDMIIRAAAMALIAVPEANASWEGENTRLFRHADIAMAVAIDGGLITPIVWAAEQKGLAALSQVTTDLAARARDGKLAANEYTGGSFTISNLGMFGVREFAAVINPPHGGILAVGAGEQRPIVIDGNLAVATVMSVTLSADHRAVDGAVGARWLQAFKGFVENPVTMLL